MKTEDVELLVTGQILGMLRIKMGASVFPVEDEEGLYKTSSSMPMSLGIS